MTISFSEGLFLDPTMGLMEIFGQFVAQATSNSSAFFRHLGIKKHGMNHGKNEGQKLCVCFLLDLFVI